jgi:SAM-dependent methyltransferase
VKPTTPADPYAPLKDNAWREIAEIDEQLERGQINEAEWHAAMAALVVPKYVAADTPWGGSGKTGTYGDWAYSRSLIAHAIDRDGSFLDVGCANGYLLECLVGWTPHRLDGFGLDIAPELVDLARRRLPQWSDRFFVGNALDWSGGRRFTYARANLDAVPPHRRRQLVGHLQGLSERLIIGVFNEQVEERPTEELIRSWGYHIQGRSERANRHKPAIDYRLLWIDSEEGR